MRKKYGTIVRKVLFMTVPAAIVLVMFLAVIAPAGANVRAATAHNVYMDNLTFKPQTVTIQVGDTVLWTNNDTSLHTTTADGGEWDSGDMAKGDTFSFTFTSQGTYTYHCERHLGMTGTVIVGPVIPEFSSATLVVIGLLAVFLAVVGIRSKR